MDFAPSYLIVRFFFRIGDFFRHWYTGGSLVIGHKLISTLQGMDRSFAVKVTLTHFFEPLYRDYSPIGRILGIIFRAGRIIIGVAVYAAVALIFLAVYILWAALPAVLLSIAIYHGTKQGF